LIKQLVFLILKIKEPITRVGLSILVGLLLLMTISGCCYQAHTKEDNVGQGYVLQQLTRSSIWSGRDSMGEAVYKGKIWLSGGFTPERSNEVWWSEDAIEWHKAPAPLWTPRNLHGMVVFKDYLYVLGGIDSGTKALNDVYRSKDGLTWELLTDHAPWGPRAAFGCVVHKGSLYIYGGNGNEHHWHDVWSTTDGLSWKQVTAGAPWAERGMFTALSFENKIWVIGGGIYDDKYLFNIKNNYNDVWSSPDGETWTLEIAEAPFTPRRFQSGVIYDNHIFMIAGYELDQRIFANNRNGLKNDDPNIPLKLEDNKSFVGRAYGNLNDIWSSADGVRWEKLCFKTNFAIRHEPSLVNFKDSIFIIGGFGLSLYNDIYVIKKMRSEVGRE
jgi:hypothetical protein